MLVKEDERVDARDRILINAAKEAKTRPFGGYLEEKVVVIGEESRKVWVPIGVLGRLAEEVVNLLIGLPLGGDDPAFPNTLTVAAGILPEDVRGIATRDKLPLFGAKVASVPGVELGERAKSTVDNEEDLAVVGDELAVTAVLGLEELEVFSFNDAEVRSVVLSVQLLPATAQRVDVRDD